MGDGAGWTGESCVVAVVVVGGILVRGVLVGEELEEDGFSSSLLLLSGRVQALGYHTKVAVDAIPTEIASPPLDERRR